MCIRDRISRDQAEEILSALQSVAIDEYSQLKWRTTSPIDAEAASAVTSAAGSYHEPMPPGVHLEGREEERYVFATPPGYGDELNYLIHSNGVPYAELLKTWPQIYEEAGYRLRNPQYGLPDLTSPQEEIRTRVADREPIPANDEFTTFNRRYFCAVTDWKRAILRGYGHKVAQEIYKNYIFVVVNMTETNAQLHSLGVQHIPEACVYESGVRAALEHNMEGYTEAKSRRAIHLCQALSHSMAQFLRFNGNPGRAEQVQNKNGSWSYNGRGCPMSIDGFFTVFDVMRQIYYRLELLQEFIPAAFARYIAAMADGRCNTSRRQGVNVTPGLLLTMMRLQHFDSGEKLRYRAILALSLIHISEPTRLRRIWDCGVWV